jgi:hypothetical protein
MGREIGIFGGNLRQPRCAHCRYVLILLVYIREQQKTASLHSEDQNCTIFHMNMLRVPHKEHIFLPPEGPFVESCARKQPLLILGTI